MNQNLPNPPANVPVDTGLHRAEHVFAVVTALVFWTDILWLVFPGVSGAPSAMFRSTMLVLYVMIAGVLALKPLLALDALQRSPGLTALLVMPLVSVVWSIAPGETLSRSIALMGSSAFGLYLATHMSETRVLSTVAMASILAAGLSVILIFAVPTIGVMQDGEYVGVWRGAYSHKNAFGGMTALGAVVCLVAWKSARGGATALYASGFFLNLLLLAGSRSLTAQITVLGSVVVFLTAGRVVRAVYDNAIVLASSVAVVTVLCALTLNIHDIAELLESFGKDLTFSARVPLWQLVIPFAEERFWLGYGYEAFWVDGHHAVDIITQRMRFNPIYSHNGILELWLGIGAVGVALFVGVFGRFIFNAMTLLYREPRHPIYLLSLIYSFLLILGNMSEATLLQRNSMSWILLVTLAFMLARDYAGRTASEPHAPHPTALEAAVAHVGPHLNSSPKIVVR
jgi:exopolysaccharide production protein ExoQ